MEQNKNIRVRFAPSPTGYLHIGGARTALFNYLFARHTGGTFILRLEDTDRTRYQPDSVKEIYESLRWLGLSWDEGPEAGGDCGPYIQSQRSSLYREQADELLKSGHAYRCFCSSERLEQVRLEREKLKEKTSYDRHCRELSQDEIRRLTAEGMPHVVRLKVPLARKVVFNDMIRGAIEYTSEVLDDLVLLKSDGLPTYHLANVVDDHFMKISHVLRGEEWIASTPRHILIYEALGWLPPHFAHMPVILSPDGGKLSKRKGAASVMDYQRAGFLPDALFNFLALLGWASGDDREKMTRGEIVGAFTLEKVSPKAAVLDEKKLEWMNGLYMQEQSVESLAGAALEHWKKAGILDNDVTTADSRVITAVKLLKDRSRKITELVENGRYFFVDPVIYEEKAARKNFCAETADVLDALSEKLGSSESFDHASLERLYHAYAESIPTNVGTLIHPTRLAVSGVSFGPGLFELLEALGKNTVVRRMKTAADLIRRSNRN
jgi:glutamyl-tRNA synthetase